MASLLRRSVTLATSFALVICFFGPVAAADAKPAAVKSITLLPESPKQGQTMRVMVETDDGDELPLVQFDKKSYKLFAFKQAGDKPNPHLYRALVPVNPTLETGSYDLHVGGIEKKLKVVAGGFGVQHLHLPKEKDNFISSPGEEETVEKAKAVLTDAQYWDGPFKRPSTARVSTAFGLRRVVNGKLLKDYFHSGIDYAAYTGSPVVAPEAGKVIFAQSGWKLHGNCIAIDHGQGVVSFYLHLSKLMVKSGDTVKAGQIIGKVGATGRANGPHLHYSMYVNGTATNPADWFAKAY